MIQLPLHESDPRNQPKMTEFWTPVGRWGDHFLQVDYSPGKVVCCCTSTTLRRYPPGGVPRTCLKALPSRRDTCIGLPQRYIKSEDFEQCLESPRPYPQHDGMEQKN